MSDVQFNAHTWEGQRRVLYSRYIPCGTYLSDAPFVHVLRPAGDIPPALGGLTALTALKLHYNKLTGELDGSSPRVSPYAAYSTQC